MEKGLIDAMSSFGVKAILIRDIVSHDCSFESSNDVCECLSSRCDSRMSHTNLNPKSIDEKRQNKEGHKIKVCMSQQIFEYVPILRQFITANIYVNVKNAQI